MATWQARLVSETYDLLYVEPPSTLDAFAFWTTIKELCPPITPIILGGTHAQLAPFLSENLFQYRYSWTLVSTSTPKDSGRRCPHVRTRVLHLFCAHMPRYKPQEMIQADSPGVRRLPSDVFYVHEHMTSTPPDVLQFVCGLHGAEKMLRLF